MITKILKSSDMLVNPYEFNIHQRQKSLTVVGGFISILILISSLFYVVGVFQKAMQNQNSIYAGTQSDNPNQFQLDQFNTIFAMEISKLDGTIMNDINEISKYFDINIQYIQQQRSTNIIGFKRNYTNLNMQKCSNSRMKQFNFQQASLTQAQIENLICFDGNYNITGQFYDSYFSYIKLQISLCSNSTNNNNCKSLTEITQYITDGVNVDLFIKDTQIKQQLNLTEPANTFPTNIFWRLTTGIGNNEDIYMSPIQFDLKTNQLFSELLNQDNTQKLFNSSQLARQERRQEPIIMTNGASMCTFYFRASPNSIYFFAIQSDMLTIILSSVSETMALALAIMEFIKIFYKVYNQHKTFEILMNSVFKFDLESIRQKRESTLTPYDQMHRKSEINNRTKLHDLFNFTIQYSFIKFIAYQIVKLCKCCQKRNFFRLEKQIVISQIAKSKIESDLDLTNILKKLYEIDCLKLFLFDDDQLMMFNSFCSPVFQDQMIQQKDLFQILQVNQQKRSINKLNNNSQISKQREILDKVDYTFVATSDIPLNIRLSKVARFFKAQLEASDGNQLIQTFKRINSNLNQNHILNSKLMQFAKQNLTLYKLVTLYVEFDDNQNQNLVVPEEIIENSNRQFKQQGDSPIISHPSNHSEIVSHNIPSQNKQSISGD